MQRGYAGLAGRSDRLAIRRPAALGDGLLMKGVVLAGGLGTRLLPLTRITNKHLLPVFDRPMIYYPLQALINAGIRDILIVTGGAHAGDFLRLLGNGKDFGLERLHYAYQEGEGGIAAALVARGALRRGRSHLRRPRRQHHRGLDRAGGAPLRAASRAGARVILKEVPDAERFGVAEIRRRPGRCRSSRSRSGRRATTR